MDYGPKRDAGDDRAAGATDANSAGQPLSIERYCSAGGTICRCRRRGRERPHRPRPASVEAPAAASAGEPTSPNIRVTTDVLVLDISLAGGSLVRAELPAYPHGQGSAAPVVLFNRDSAATNYVLQSGLRTARTARTRAISRRTRAPADSYALAPGQDELRVPLTWTDGNGITSPRPTCSTAACSRSSSTIGSRTRRSCRGKATRTCRSTASIRRSSARCSRSRVLRLAGRQCSTARNTAS